MGEPEVVLLWGEDEFLLRDAAHDLLRERGLQATEVAGGEWRGGETSDLATPSLFGERRALFVTGAQALSEAGLAELRGYLASPAPRTLCVVTWVTKGRTGPPLAKAVAGTRAQVRHVETPRRDLPRWVLGRADRRGLRLRPPGAQALVQAIGDDPASLDQAVEQLAGAFAGVDVGESEVRQQFRGVGEQRVWDLCDHALAGRVSQALVVLRSMLDAREEPLLILGGIGSRVRDLLRVRDLPPRAPASQAGLRFDWQLKRYRDQAARFGPGELSALHERVVEADRALKGGMAGDIVLTSLVNVMGGDPSGALDVPVRVSR
jgi:DNA polymerase-3 subunit delta